MAALLERRRQTMVRAAPLACLLAICLLANYASAARLNPSRGRHAGARLGNGVGPELLPYDPVANKASVVNSQDGKARFTVLTGRLIRLEYTDTGAFEDRASTAFVNRNLGTPKFGVQQDNETTVIKTDFLSLTYKENSNDEGFTAANLDIKTLGDFQVDWAPGMQNTGALPGAIKSLDGLGVQTLNCTVIEEQNIEIHHEKLHCNWALFSRSGWTVFDDTPSPMIDPNDPDGWWQLDQPNANKQDWYFFGHGLDYIAALRDYRAVGGVIPMLPRQVFGTWWTRWFNYNTNGIKDVVDNFRMYSLPLDVLVYDMNWHTKDGSPDGWTGYSWDERVLPNHQQLNNWLKAQDLTLSCNIHDNEGVGHLEHRYEATASAAGIDPSTNATVPFSVANKTLMLAVEDQALNPLKANGSAIDFFWIDWQQGGKQGGALGGRSNPTFWLNKVRCTDAKRLGSQERTMVLGRWGGLGNHRYQLGFSGDINDHQPTPLNWDALAYQPYYSASGSTVSYGFWSHDILTAGADPELSLRWVQWGANSGVMRFHDRGLSSGACNDPFKVPGQTGSCEIDLIWKQPYQYFQGMRSALHRRSALIPYLYNAAREAFDTGISLIRPLYLYHSEHDLAYANNMHGDYTSYYLGPDMIVAPVVVPVNKDTNLASTTIWLPPRDDQSGGGFWVETSTGNEISVPANGSVVTHDWDITEIPTYVKGGAILPISLDLEPGRTIGRAAGAYERLGFEIFPSQDPSATRSTLVYEDDSKTTAYLDNEYGITKVTAASNGGSSVTITLEAPKKPYKWMPQMREYVFLLVNSAPATSVKVGDIFVSSLLAIADPRLCFILSSF